MTPDAPHQASDGPSHTEHRRFSMQPGRSLVLIGWPWESRKIVLMVLLGFGTMHSPLVYIRVTSGRTSLIPDEGTTDEHPDYLGWEPFRGSQTPLVRMFRPDVPPIHPDADLEHPDVRLSPVVRMLIACPVHSH